MESKPDKLSKRTKSEERHPLWTLLDAISAEHAKQGARITELRAKVAAMTLESATRYRCEGCGVVFRLASNLQWHRYARHGGPLPDDEVAAEVAAGFRAERESQAPTPSRLPSTRYDVRQPPAEADAPTSGAVHASSHARASVTVSDGGNAQTAGYTATAPATR